MSQATWEEVKRLAADLQRAQLSETFQRLSDRNCIEIVNKLTALKLLHVVHTADGKEYLTEQEICKEIREELQVNGGRIGLSELQSAINIDYSHIESKCNDMVRSDPSMNLILGQLIDRSYTDKLAEDLNDFLQEHGQLALSDLTKQYDLPATFIHEVVQDHLGSGIQGTLDNDILFTDKFVRYHRHVIRGAFSGLTRPKSIQSVMDEYKLQERLFHKVMSELMKAGDLLGAVSGGKGDKSLYIPDIYTQAQTRWVQDYFQQNGYLEFDSISRLGISDPKLYVKKLLKNESLVYLKKCVVGKTMQEQVTVLVDEALRTASWVDVQQYLPSCISVEDAGNIVQSTIATKTDALSFQSVVVSKLFLKSCQDLLAAKIDTKAREDIAKNPNLLNTLTEEDNSKFQHAKEDRRDQRKKKQSGASKSGGGTQGREVKMKATKNKYRAGGKNDDDDDNDVTSSSRDVALEFMSSDAMEEVLSETHPAVPADVMADIVSAIHRPLNKQYLEHVKDLFMRTSGVASGSGRKKTHNDIQEKIGCLWSNIKLFEKGIENFPDDVQANLNKHLLTTLCSEVTNAIFKNVAIDHMIATENDLNPERRMKILSSMQEDDLRKKLTNLHQSLTKSVSDFCDASEEVCGPEHLGILLRKVDKKKERQIVHGHRMALLEQLENELEPALGLHLCTVIMYQTVSGCMLHAPGRCVPQIITYLSSHLDDGQRLTLTEYQNDVIRSMKCDADNDVRAALHDHLPRLKELAITFKKNGKQ